MTELVMVIVIIGILAAVVLPRFFDRNTFDSRAFHDQTVSILRYAQKAAIAQRRFVCVAFTANSVTLMQGQTSACGATLSGPTGGAPYAVIAPAGVTLAGFVDFNFNARGVASSAQNIAVSGYPAPIIVEAETGYVH